MFHVSLRRMCILMLDEVNYIQLIDVIVEFNYVPTDSLPARSVHFW